MLCAVARPWAPPVALAQADVSEAAAAEAEEIPLGDWPAQGLDPLAKPSPDGRHLAWVIHDDEGVRVAADGRAGPAFRQIFRPSAGDAPPTFRPDGCVEYIGERDGTIYRVIQPPPR